MITLIFLLFVMLGFLAFLVIWDPIANLLKSRVIAGGILGFLLAKYLGKKGDDK
nr:MAG TPA: ATP synthase B/B' [Caudoviricetes sp.]